MVDGLIDWLGALGEQYGVDPVVYAVLYVGAAPLLFGSLGWLIRRIRRSESVLLPAVASAFFFSVPTLYVIIAGRELPAWVYAVLAVLAGIGAVITVRHVRNAVRRTR
jgi:ABC-type Co2+ transport system permease subunit